METITKNFFIMLGILISARSVASLFKKKGGVTLKSLLVFTITFFVGISSSFAATEEIKCDFWGGPEKELSFILVLGGSLTTATVVTYDYDGNEMQRIENLDVDYRGGHYFARDERGEVIEIFLYQRNDGTFFVGGDRKLINCRKF